MAVLDEIKIKVGTSGELLQLFRKKRWWLAPMILALLLLGVIVVVAETSVAPFIYTLF
jgi:Family of unknown function (DUF5989)